MVKLSHIKQSVLYRALHKETQQLASVTGLNGPLRIYRGRSWTRIFWITVFLGCFAALAFHVLTIAGLSGQKSTNSQVSFIMAENFAFPRLTICNYNAVKRSHIERLNSTGDFTDSILQYLLQSTDDAQVLYALANYQQISNAEREYQRYKMSHPEFSINKFYNDAGFTCPEIMKLCTFAGRRFNCCSYAKPVLTSFGGCQVLNMQNSDYDWMRKQSEEGMDAGLQLVLDAHIEEQAIMAEDNAVLPNQIENGFWFYIDEAQANTYVGTEGISASPGGRAYSELSASHYLFLDKANWGDCTGKWPEGYEDASTKYGVKDCIGKCRARFFNDVCACAPFQYNGKGDYRSCTPLETYECIERNVVLNLNTSDEIFSWPECKFCTKECDKWEYVSYNSYGRGFSDGALKWLSAMNTNWTAPHVKSNFVTINVYFRDMIYTEYTQAQVETIAEVFGDLGGSMSGYLGMSIVTCCELVIFLWKLAWLLVIPSRRHYLVDKVHRNKKEKAAHEEAVDNMKKISRIEDGHNLPKTSLAKRITNVVRRHSSVLITLETDVKRRAQSSGTIRSSGSIQKKERKRLYNRRNHTNGRSAIEDDDYLDAPVVVHADSDSGIALSESSQTSSDRL